MRFSLLLFVFSTSMLYGQTRNATIEEAPAWIVPVSFNTAANPAPLDEGGYYCLLIDRQEHVAREENFSHIAYKILTAEGVRAMSDLTIIFDPVYQELKVHSIKIHRNAQVIDKMPATIPTIQREQSMDYNLYDGSLTALVHVTDVRIGDVLEYAFTVAGRNPVFDGHFSKIIYHSYPTAYEKLFERLVTPPSSELKFKHHNTDLKPEVVTTSHGKEYIWKLERIEAFLFDTNVPDWYVGNQYTVVADFRDWAEVSSWGLRHFRVTDTERAKLRTAIEGKFDAADKRRYALEAIRFVQDEIRYLGLMAGLSSHKPHPPAEVLENRFGDCKDKSLLLCSILEIGEIKAFPVLVNTAMRKRVSDQLPSISAFDHCVVRFEIDGRVHYVDPTINYQGGRSMEEIYFPPYENGLVLGEDMGMEDLQQTLDVEITETQTIAIPSLGGEAYMQVSTTYTGGAADNIRREFMTNSANAIQKSYLTFYGNLFHDIEVVHALAYRDDRHANIFVVEENYRIPTFWKPVPTDAAVLYTELAPLTLQNYFSVAKSSQRTSPYHLVYPFSYHHIMTIELPVAWGAVHDEAFIDNDYYHYEYYVRPEGKKINVETHYRTKQDHVPLMAFPTFVSDHEKMHNNLTYQLSYNSLMTVETGVSWLGIMTAIGGLGLGVWLMLWLYYYYDPAPDRPGDDGEPIGGWLILTAIGLILAPIVMIGHLWQSTDFYDNQFWANLLAMKSYVLFAYLLLIDHMGRFVMLTFVVLILVLFVRRRSSLPRLMIIYLACSAALHFIDIVGGGIINPAIGTQPGYYYSLIPISISCCIWIPYFMYSSRVKETFITRIGDDDDMPPVSAAQYTEARQ